jgi:hypothetical protein
MDTDEHGFASPPDWGEKEPRNPRNAAKRKPAHRNASGLVTGGGAVHKGRRQRQRIFGEKHPDPHQRRRPDTAIQANH